MSGRVQTRASGPDLRGTRGVLKVGQAGRPTSHACFEEYGVVVVGWSAQRLTHYYAEINAAHPFREGNGRAQRRSCAN
jgi:Fic/DOC family